MNGLVSENRRLADALTAATGDRDAALDGAERAAKLLEPLTADLATTRQKLDDCEKLAKATAREWDRLRRQVELAEAQQAEVETERILPPEEVADIVGSMIDKLRGSLPELGVAATDLKLHLAFAKVGGQLGLVAPTPDAPAEVRASLHEVNFRLGRSARPAD